MFRIKKHNEKNIFQKMKKASEQIIRNRNRKKLIKGLQEMSKILTFYNDQGKEITDFNKLSDDELIKLTKGAVKVLEKLINGK